MAYQYQPPDLKDLVQDIPQRLRQLYQGPRESNITFLERVFGLKFPNNEDDEGIVLGGYLFIMELINQEYAILGMSPEFQQGKIYNTGSRLYSGIKSCLQIHGDPQPNLLGDDEALIYLAKFYHFIENHPQLNNTNFFQGLPWQDKTALLKDLKAMLKQVKTREYDRIAIIAEGKPRLQALMKNVEEIGKAYEEEVSKRWLTSSWFSSAKAHLSLLDSVRFINATCDLIYSDKNDDSSYLTECNVRLGAIIYMLVTINENAYIAPHGSWLNSGSKLLQGGLQAINKKALKDIDRGERIEWLRALSTHLIEIKRLYKLDDKQLKKVLIENKISFDQLEELHREIEKKIPQQEEKQKSSTKRDWAIYGTSSAIQYGLGFFAAEASMNFLLPAAFFSGPIGWLTIGVVGGGTILMTTLGKLVAEKVIPMGVSYLYVKLLEKAGNVVATKAVDLTANTIENTRKNFQDWLHTDDKNQRMEKRFMKDWIDTLLNLPDDVMSKEEKEQIRTVIGPMETLEHSFVFKH